MKSTNLENWSSEELSKDAKIWLSRSIFYVKNHSKLSDFFHWRMRIQEHIFCYWHFLITSIFESLYFLKVMLNFKITSMQVGNSYYTDEMYTKLHSIMSNLTKHLVTLTMTGYKCRNWPKLKANRHKDTYCTKMTWNDIAKIKEACCEIYFCIPKNNNKKSEIQLQFL